ncbi:MAG: type I pullulanase [Oscillospiraceae bacterium]|nr:type I pullulanase [Oscillospiraceae bacterium]
MDLTEQKVYFDSAEFEQLYHYDGPLGAFCGREGSKFYLWAPTAQAVLLRLYKDGHLGGAYQMEKMASIGQGVWCWETKQDLNGIYYDYQLTVNGINYETADPYAKAAGVNGERSMVIDLASTDPIGWSEDTAPAQSTETIIYETHVKDFSWDPASGVQPRWRGKYLAFCEEKTTLNGKGVAPTCLNYMKSLGVTHVQLMPVYDFGSVNEMAAADEYNWGYDPVNYNVPEGSYSTDPYHGQVRIRELKRAIQSLHKNGFRVIMDVVYNHTYHLESCLFKTVPWYFYRQTADGGASNGSGCGNELATERSMCARYILDSVLYWAEEYHIDGFRFDLMGLMDVALMEQIRSALDARWGKDEKLLYGEPWGGGTSNPRKGTQLGHKGNLHRLPSSVGAFCDVTRDMIKGSTMSAADAGIINGGYIVADIFDCCLRAWAFDNNRFHVETPGQTICYLSCHDDWTLWDKLILTLDEQGKRFIEPCEKVLAANKLGAALIFGCQGRPFILSGEEFGRTKLGLRNSYNATSSLNQLDWSRSVRFSGLVDYYKGLIALRKQLPALCDKSKAAFDRILRAKDLGRNFAGFLLNNQGSDSRWDQILLLYNVSAEPQNFSCPEGTWEVLLDAESSFRWQKPEAVKGSLKLSPVSAMYIGRKKGK